ncbi:hypothetical protein B0J13DRAFT_211127 [Dactylonectria estremocensis]|uniref:Secreted protein n=1 Tax=Dactylonectria estremocensis TaxID=1079267 RepID=A0A9P9F794_9HYPO|nr:hypothetical protein B0J13DRAFT_211127 [Dactylonectria estremocensis]
MLGLIRHKRRFEAHWTLPLLFSLQLVCSACGERIEWGTSPLRAGLGWLVRVMMTLRMGSGMTPVPQNGRRKDGNQLEGRSQGGEQEVPLMFAYWSRAETKGIVGGM